MGNLCRNCASLDRKSLDHVLRTSIKVNPGQGVKALESRAKSVEHQQRLPKTDSTVIPFPNTNKAQPAEASALKQMNIADVNVKQLASKAEIM